MKDVWSHILERETEILVSFPFSALLATISPSTTHLYTVSKIEGSNNYGPGSLTHSSISNIIGNIFSYTGLRIKGLNLIFFLFSSTLFYRSCAVTFGLLIKLHDVN